MRLLVVLALGAVAVVCPSAQAQEPPPRIPVVVVDLHVAVPNFSDDLRVAASRGLHQAQLPGVGAGGDVGVHVYPFRWRAITFGVGGQATLARARRAPEAVAGQTALSPVTEYFRSIAPQL